MYAAEMNSLNYHHLYYFWIVAREGSIARACERLYVAQPTISGQIKALEEAIGDKLFTRNGKKLSITETGRVVYRYAEEIFRLGSELADTLSGQPAGRPLRFTVGAAGVLPKLIVYRLIRPAMDLPQKVHLIYRGATLNRLLADLSVQDLDLILSDSPLDSELNVRAVSQLLGECGVSVFASKSMAAACRRSFPQCLDGSPILMPAADSSLRHSLDAWLETEEIRPAVWGEFEDSVLMHIFGQMGEGFFAAATVVEKDICRQYRVEVIGRMEEVRTRFYAITARRMVKHPAVVAITEAARRKLFV